MKDIETAKRFYVEVLGLKIERYHPTYVQFDKFAIAGGKPLAGDTGPGLYWLVDNAEATFAELSQNAEVSVALQEKPFGTVFAIKDPDGRPRYLLELAKDRPSKPVQ